MKSIKPKISIIMPSLNVAEYIEKCIQSVIDQTLQEIEILCIDAGSTDGTLQILQAYACRDKRIQIIQSEKKSYGYQVNKGISLARGTYIAIVETDDYIAQDMFEILIKYGSMNNLDYVKSDFNRFKTLENDKFYFEEVHVIEGKEIPYGLLLSKSEIAKLHGIDVNVWNGIYKKEFLLSNNIRFTETAGAAFQDIGFLQQVNCCGEKVMFLRKPLYQYRTDRDEASSNLINGFQYAYYEFKCLMENHFFTQMDKEHFRWFYYRMVISFIVEIRKVIYARDMKWMESEFASYYQWFRKNLLEAYLQGDIEQKDYAEDNWIELQLLLQSAEKYALYLKEKKEMLEAYQDTLKGVIGDEHVVIFGGGSYGRSAYQLLEAIEINIDAFCDNNKNLWNQSIEGIKVLAPEECVLNYKGDIFIIANKIHGEDIRKQISKLGISKDQIINFHLSMKEQ